MAKFSSESEDKLSKCDSRIVEVMRTVIQFIDFTIICGHRNQRDQDIAYNLGNSKVKYPESKHNTMPSKAIDVAPYPLNWGDTESFIYLAGYIMMTAELLDIKLKWGGDWNRNDRTIDEKFRDIGHFEIDE